MLKIVSVTLFVVWSSFASATCLNYSGTYRFEGEYGYTTTIRQTGCESISQDWKYDSGIFVSGSAATLGKIDRVLRRDGTFYDQILAHTNSGLRAWNFYYSWNDLETYEYLAEQLSNGDIRQTMKWTYKDGRQPLERIETLSKVRP